jgi:7-cyano-7-deazaguanine synthase
MLDGELIDARLMARNSLLAADAALVLFSGGQDSATCLAWALDRFARVETIGFDYGQRHAVELAARERVRAGLVAAFPAWGAKLGPDQRVDLSGYGALAESALTAEREIAFADTGLPTTFVPGRNLVFLAAAGAHAYRRGLGRLVGGMCETDYSGYPDCRAATIEAMARALALGLDAEIAIDTPLMHITKAETWALAHELGGDGLVALILEETHSCYRGVREARHAWGYGCGDCPACELRAKGWSAWSTPR